MNFKHLISIFLAITLSCSPVKQINENIVSGEFDKAISKTIDELKKTKNKKKKIQYESILSDIFKRSVIKSENTINRLKEDGNPELYVKIYSEYRIYDYT